MSLVHIFLIGLIPICLFAALGYLINRHRMPLVAWCLPLGILLCSTYAINIWGGESVYWGIRSDQSFQIALTNNVIHNNFFGDSFDKRVANHYPPLLFWVSGIAARLVGMDAVEVTRWMPALLFLLLPLLIFAVGRHLGGSAVGVYSCLTILALGSFTTAIYGPPQRGFGIVSDFVLKPHEVIGGLLIILWLLRTLGIPHPVGKHWLTGLTGGIVILLFYPWFVLGLAACILYWIIFKQRPSAPDLTVNLIAALLISSPYWLPLAHGALTLGWGESAQMQYFSKNALDISAYTIGIGHFGSLFILSMVGVKRLVRKKRIPPIYIVVVILYLWVLSTYVTYPLFDKTFLPQKTKTLLIISLGFISAEFLNGLKIKWSFFRQSILALLLLPHALHWNIHSDSALKDVHDTLPKYIQELVQIIDPDDESTIAGLDDSLYYLPGFTRLRVYLAPQIFYANPLTHFRKRLEAIRMLQKSTTPQSLRDALQGMGIDYLIFRRISDDKLRFVVRTDYKDGKYRGIRITFTDTILHHARFKRMYDSNRIVVYKLDGADRKTGLQIK